MFARNSRYADAKTYEVPDGRGRSVAVVSVPAAPSSEALGRHRLKQGQRLDHLAYRYLGDPEAFWRICELNDVMLPEALSEAPTVLIPRRRT